MSSALIVDLESILSIENSRLLIDEAIKSPATVVTLNILWDTPPADQWIFHLSRWIADLQSAGKKTILILNSYYETNQNLIKSSHADEIIFLDFFLVLVYVRLILKKESQVCRHWDSTSEKFLFLTGKPNRKNRIGWLYRFYQDNLLDRCTWSLHVPDHVREISRSFLPIQDDHLANQWIDNFSRNPDNISPVHTGENSIHYSGIPYGNIYQSSLFQVVSESFSIEGSRTPWITEKTWLSIINRRPFILASYPGVGCYQYLKHRGFLTFDEFLLDTEFDSIIDDDLRWQSLVRNIRHWLDVLPDHHEKVTEILEYNYNRLTEIAQKNIDLLRAVSLRYGINDNDNIDSLVKFYDPHQHSFWKNWYSRIRDISWPDCDREEDFYLLPERIKKECIEVFGYRPKYKFTDSECKL